MSTSISTQFSRKYSVTKFKFCASSWPTGHSDNHFKFVLDWFLSHRQKRFSCKFMGN